MTLYSFLLKKKKQRPQDQKCYQIFRVSKFLQVQICSLFKLNPFFSYQMISLVALIMIISNERAYRCFKILMFQKTTKLFGYKILSNLKEIDKSFQIFLQSSTVCTKLKVKELRTHDSMIKRIWWLKRPYVRLEHFDLWLTFLK